MQRTIRILVLAGAPLMAFGLWSLAVDTEMPPCHRFCPPASELAGAVAAQIADGVPITLLCTVPVALAWLLCLVRFARAHRPWALAALALALPLVAALSLVVVFVGTNGQPLPTTWEAFKGEWASTVLGALALLLLWPFAIVMANESLLDR